MQRKPHAMLMKYGRDAYVSTYLPQNTNRTSPAVKNHQSLPAEGVGDGRRVLAPRRSGGGGVCAACWLAGGGPALAVPALRSHGSEQEAIRAR